MTTAEPMSGFRMMTGEGAASGAAWRTVGVGSKTAALATAVAASSAGDARQQTDSEDADATPGEVFSQLLANSQPRPQTRQQVTWTPGPETFGPSLFVAMRSPTLRIDRGLEKEIDRSLKPRREPDTAVRSGDAARSISDIRRRETKAESNRWQDSHRAAHSGAGAEASNGRVQMPRTDTVSHERSASPGIAPRIERTPSMQRGSERVSPDAGGVARQEADGARLSRVDARVGGEAAQVGLEADSETTQSHPAPRPVEGLQHAASSSATAQKEVDGSGDYIKKQPIRGRPANVGVRAELPSQNALGASPMARRVEEQAPGSMKGSLAVVAEMPGGDRQASPGRQPVQEAVWGQTSAREGVWNADNSRGAVIASLAAAPALASEAGSAEGQSMKSADPPTGGLVPESRVAGSRGQGESLSPMPESGSGQGMEKSAQETEGTAQSPTKQGTAAGKEFGFQLNLRSQNPVGAQTGSNGVRTEASTGWSERTTGVGTAHASSDVGPADPTSDHFDMAESQQRNSAGLRAADQASLARHEITAPQPTVLARSAAMEAARQNVAERQQQASRFSRQPAARRQVFAVSGDGKQVLNTQGAGQAAAGNRPDSASSKGNQKTASPAMGTGLAVVAPAAGNAAVASTSVGTYEAVRGLVGEGSGGKAGAMNSPANSRAGMASGNASMDVHLAAKEAFSAASARSILVKLPATMRGDAVNLRFLQRGDAVDIRVASPSVEAAQQLRGELPTLLSRLQQAGLQPEAIVDLDAARQNQDGALRRSTQEHSGGQLRQHAGDERGGLADDGRGQHDEQSGSTADRAGTRTSTRGSVSSELLPFEQFMNQQAQHTVAPGDRPKRGEA